MPEISIKTGQARAWYIVFVSALMGCGLSATAPQFSMTVTLFAAKSGIASRVLLSSETVKAAGIVLGMLVSGFLYKRMGAKKAFLTALAVSAVPQFLLPHISSAALMVALKFIQGTSSLMFPILMSIIFNWIDEKNAGTASAVYTGIFYGGGGIGGTLSGFIIARLGWAVSYYAIGAVQLVMGLVWVLTVKEAPAVSAAAAVGGAPALSGKGASGEKSPSGEKGSAPQKKGSLLRDSRLWLLALSLFATTWTVQAITVDMPIFAEYLGYDEVSVGKVLSAFTFGIILTCLVSGRVSDFFAGRAARRGGRKDLARLFVLSGGYVLAIISLGLLIFADTTRFSVFYAAVFLVTFGAAWGLGAFYCILPEIYDEETVPVITGITGGIGDAGMAFAPMVVGVVFGIRGLWAFGWGTCAAISVVSILATLALAFKLGLRRSLSS